MDSRIKQIADELYVTIFCDASLSKKAHYIATQNIIIVNGDLSEFETQKAILHELGHAAKHRENYAMYNLAHSLHSKMENEAEEFMIEQMIEIKLQNLDFNSTMFNCVNFLENLNLDLKYEEFVKQFMTNYFVDSAIELDGLFF